MEETREPTTWRSWSLAAAPLIAIALLLFILPGYHPEWRAQAFVACLLLLILHIMAIGWLVNGRPAGAFIDNRNRLSLSKLQMGAWTVVVLSAFATAASFNAAVDMFQNSAVTSLAVTIPGELLIAMGISATSLVATPALLSLKAQEPPQPQEAVDKASDRVATSVRANGNVLSKAEPHDASWADLVTGDEVGNAGSPDLGKIQQGLITLLLLGTYTAYIYADFGGSAEKIATLPTLDQSFVWLMGISHASYLGYKAAPHTSSGDKQTRSDEGTPPPPPPPPPPATGQQNIGG